MLLDRRLYCAVALVTAGALLVEVTLTRLLSVALWYPFAYLALAVALLGWGAAALGLGTSTRLRTVPVERMLVGSALAFGLSTVLGYPLWNALSVDPLRATLEPWAGLRLIVWCLVLALPFAGAGMFTCRVLLAWSKNAARLTACSSSGAALGVLAYVLLVPHLGAPATLMLGGAAGVVAALLLFAGGLHGRAALAVLAAATVVAGVQSEEWLPLHITPAKLLGSVAATPRHTQWGVASALDIVDPKDGSDPAIVLEGGTALAVLPRAAPGQPRQQGLRALPFLFGAHTAVILGSGGGLEVRAALDAGVDRIVALEIDPGINHLVTGSLAALLGGLFAEKRVELHTADARSYLASHPEHFDAIVGVHTVTHAALAHNAFGLVENYLFTVEGLQLALNRLSDSGVLLLSRPEPQTGRLCASLAAAWPFDSDIHQHAAVVSEGKTPPDFLTAVLVSRQPLEGDALARIRSATPGRILYMPDGEGEAQAYLAGALAWPAPQAVALAESAAAHLRYRAATLQPATDDRPFFNLSAAWSTLDLSDLASLAGAGAQARRRLDELPVAQLTLVILLITVTGLSTLLLVLPGVFLRRRGAGLPASAGKTLGYAALGYGYMTVLLTLMQTLTRVLGEPAYAMLAGLGLFLAAAGLGSELLAGRWAWSPGRAALAATGAALATSLVVPHLLDATAVWPFGARLLAATVMVAPLGLLFGAPFAAALRRIEGDAAVGWACGACSVGNVTGSLAAVMISATWGLTVSGCLAAASYAAAALLLGRRGGRQEPPHA